MGIVIVLMAVVIIIIIARRNQLIGHETIQYFANIAGIVSLIAAVLFFLFPDAASTTRPQPLPSDTPMPSNAPLSLNTSVLLTTDPLVIYSKNFEISSEDTFYAIAGTVYGDYQVYPDSVVVRLKGGLIKLRDQSYDAALYNGRRNVDAVLFYLSANEGDSWANIAASNPMSLYITLSPESQFEPPIGKFVIPIDDKIDLPNVWLTFAISSYLVDGDDPQPGFAFIESKEFLLP